YAADLIARVKPDSQEDAKEAQAIIDRLKPMEQDWMNSAVITMETELLKASGQMDRATSLIKTAAERPNAQLASLGVLAEKLGLLDLAEQLLRDWEKQARAKNPLAILDLATFFGRTGRLKEAIDICEQAQANGISPEDVARVSVSALFADRNDQQTYNQ